MLLSIETSLDAHYAHAGLGRAPATALAFMYWCRGIPLLDALAQFRAVRPCNPNIQAIRQAGPWPLKRVLVLWTSIAPPKLQEFLGFLNQLTLWR